MDKIDPCPGCGKRKHVNAVRHGLCLDCFCYAINHLPELAGTNDCNYNVSLHQIEEMARLDSEYGRWREIVAKIRAIADADPDFCEGKMTRELKAMRVTRHTEPQTIRAKPISVTAKMLYDMTRLECPNVCRHAFLEWCVATMDELTEERIVQEAKRRNIPMEHEYLLQRMKEYEVQGHVSQIAQTNGKGHFVILGWKKEC